MESTARWSGPGSAASPTAPSPLFPAGELQRVQIAIGLAQEAPILIADEPTSQLDLGAAIDVAGLLRGLADDGLAVLLVVHDLALAAAASGTPTRASRWSTAARRCT
jgi:iron complex transport system ATP-binding protein